MEEQNNIDPVVTPLRRLIAVIIDRKFCLLTAIALAMTVTAAVITACVPLTLKLLVDGFQKAGATSPLILVGLWVVGLWLSRVLDNVRTLFVTKAEQRAVKSLSRMVFLHVLRLPLGFHLERQTGAISETLSRGVIGFQVIYQQLFINILPLCVELGTVALVLTKLNHPAFVTYFIAALALYAGAFVWSTQRQLRTNRASYNAYIDANAVLTDGVMNCETIKCFSAEAAVSDRYEKSLEKSYHAAINYFKSHTSNQVVLATIFGLFAAATTLYAARQVQTGSMTVGEFVLVQAYALQLVRPIEGLGSTFQSILTGFVSLEKLFQILRQEPEDLRLDFSPREQSPPHLEFKDVRFSYRGRYAALNGVSFKVAAGQTVGVVGASGAGKSSMVRLLMRFFEPDSGVILLNDKPISKIPLRKLRDSIAVVPQDTSLFNDSIGFNIGIGNPGCSEHDILHAGHIARLGDFIHTLPLGLQTPVGERGVRLSGGERQRIALARAALKAPTIYVFDEATSSLDSRTEKEIMANLHTLVRGSTTLIIAHRLSTVVHADEIIVLERGSVVERGSHQALLKIGGQYAALWRAQHADASASAA